MEKVLNTQNTIEFIDAVEDTNEAFSSISLNPMNSWAKFILTDDKPNANKQRIPIEEFDNLVNSGIFMPIKMSLGKISEGHANAVPIGTISHLKKVEDKIYGIAALWKRERPEDVELIKNNYKQGVPLQLSWEILYSDSSVSDNGVEDLKDTALRAVTLVGMPAYSGRTPILSVASSTKYTDEYINELPDDAFLFIEGGEKDATGSTTDKTKRHLPYKDAEGSVDIEQLKINLSNLENVLLSNGEKLRESEATKLKRKLERLLEKYSSKEDNKQMELEERVTQLEKDLADSTQKITDITAEKANLETELAELKSYKANIEEQKEKEERFKSIKEKFSTAKIEKDEKYFEDNKEKLLGLADEAIDFMIQELVTGLASASVNKNKTDIPNLSADSDKVSLTDMVEYLKTCNKK